MILDWRLITVKNKNLNDNRAIMKALKSIHGFKEKMDIQNQRRSQEALGMLFSPAKGMSYEAFKIENMNSEWIHKNGTNDMEHVILYFHGGAYLTGNLNYARILGAKLAQITDIDVMSIDYRLAPENPYPAQLEDAVKSWNYLLDKGYRAKNIALVGESAGGNLVLSLANYLKIHGKRMPSSIVCMSPWTDLLATGKSIEIKQELDPMLTKEFLDEATKAYCSNGDLSNPLISPLYGDFKDFPPTFIQVGKNEILLSDSLNLKKRLEQVDVECYIEIWNGMWHVFQMFPMKKATRAMQNIAIFLTAHFYSKY